MNKNNIIMSHRGIYNNKEVPENSLLAFKKSIKYNYPIELDINITKDNVLIVFHDNNLKRMTGINKNIKDITYNELRKLYLINTKEKIPTIEEVLKLVNGKVLLNIEIKKNNKYKLAIDKLIKILNTYTGNYIIQSFDHKILLYLNNKYPNIKKGLLIPNINKNKTFKYIYNILIIKICNIDFISISKKLANKKRYKKYPTYIWTIKSLEELNHYNKESYQGYICDNLPYKESSN